MSASATQATQLQVDDDGFVRAPKGLTYRILTDLGGWPGFWPGCEVRPAPGQGGAFAVRLQASSLVRPVRLVLRPHTWRHDEGFAFDLRGDLHGRGEFWLEAGWGGTVIHHLAAASVEADRPHTLGPAYRAALRRGLGGLKDALQGEVRRRLELS